MAGVAGGNTWFLSGGAHLSGDQLVSRNQLIIPSFTKKHGSSVWDAEKERIHDVH
ncbi:hypothetical protein ANO14919_040890 [Xylariales sp. No.14919]|nr:hypothetical protein ANO14919_040890 [Xylariales sp. No.14919]